MVLNPHLEVHIKIEECSSNSEERVLSGQSHGENLKIQNTLKKEKGFILNSIKSPYKIDIRNGKTHNKIIRDQIRDARNPLLKRVILGGKRERLEREKKAEILGDCNEVCSIDHLFRIELLLSGSRRRPGGGADTAEAQSVGFGSS
jgi:hypothetical protein